MAVVVRGLDALEGETAFAFLVVKLRAAVDRDGLEEVLRYLAPLVPDADAFVSELPPELEEPMRIIGMPIGAIAGTSVDCGVKRSVTLWIPAAARPVIVTSPPLCGSMAAIGSISVALCRVMARRRIW